MAVASSSVLHTPIVPMEETLTAELQEHTMKIQQLRKKIDNLPIAYKEKVFKVKEKWKKAIELGATAQQVSLLKKSYLENQNEYKKLLKVKHKYENQITAIQMNYSKTEELLLEIVHKRTAQTAALESADRKSNRPKKKIKMDPSDLQALEREIKEQKARPSCRIKIKWDVREIFNCIQYTSVHGKHLSHRVYVLGCIQANEKTDLSPTLLWKYDYAIINLNNSIKFTKVFIEEGGENLLVSPSKVVGSVIRFSMPPSPEKAHGEKVVRRSVRIVLVDEENKRWTSTSFFILKPALSPEAQLTWQNAYKQNPDEVNIYSVYHPSNVEMLTQLKKSDKKAFQHLTSDQGRYRPSTIARYVENIFPEIHE